MSIGNLILVVSSATVSYLIRYDSLLQNATAIITNAVLIILLQNASGFLLQIATVQHLKEMLKTLRNWF